MRLPFPVSSFDFPAYPGRSDEQAWADLKARVVRAEELGSRRYWLAEHQGSLFDSAPEVVLGALLGATSKITLGVAGVLLPYYSAVRVAATFQLLDCLYPGRVDLGVCRGRAPGQRHADLLDGKKDAGVEEFEAKCRGLHDEMLHPRTPRSSRAATWLLGSGQASRDLAAELGTHYCHSLLHNGSNTDVDVLRPLRRSATGADRRTAIAVAGLLAADAEEAARSIDYVQFAHITPSIVGDEASCRDALLELHDQYGFDELVFLHAATSEAAVHQSMSLLLSH